MSSHALTISFDAGAAASSDLVLLEQEQDGAYAGRLTKLGMTRYLDHALFAVAGAAAPNVVDCGVSGGNIDTALLVWPLKENVPYRLVATIGDLGAGEPGEVEETDTVSYTLTSSATLKHPARRILATEWLTGPWTTGGVKIAPPPLMVDGRELRADIPVYGSVRVRTLARLHRHRLRIAWSEAKALLATDDWSEWAVCLPASGRPVAVALTANAGAVDMARSGKECGRRMTGSFHVNASEAEWPPPADPADKELECRYCSGKCEGEDDE